MSKLENTTYLSPKKKRKKKKSKSCVRQSIAYKSAGCGPPAFVFSFQCNIYVYVFICSMYLIQVVKKTPPKLEPAEFAEPCV